MYRVHPGPPPHEHRRFVTPEGAPAVLWPLVVIDEPDRCRGIYKQSRCSLAKEVQLLFGRPVIQSTPTTREFQKAGPEE